MDFPKLQQNFTMREAKARFPSLALLARLTDSVIFFCDRCGCELAYESVTRIEGGLVCGSCYEAIEEVTLKNHE